MDWKIDAGTILTYLSGDKLKFWDISIADFCQCHSRENVCD